MAAWLGYRNQREPCEPQCRVVQQKGLDIATPAQNLVTVPIEPNEEPTIPSEHIVGASMSTHVMVPYS